MWAIALSSVSLVGSAMAQTPRGGWSPPVPVARTEGQLSLSTLVSDDRGRLHLFYTDRPGENLPGAINYMRWDDSGWSQPLDVIIDPETDGPNGPRAAIDNQKNVYVIWGGANRSLRYASAPLAEAGSASAWSTPKTLAQSLPASHDIIATSDGALHIAYSSSSEQNTASMITSTDLGQTWSAPAIIAEMASGVNASDVRLAMDGAGRFHAVWTEYQLPDGWPPTGVYYSRSTDGGVTWSAARQVAPEWHAQIGVTTVGNDAVHLAWRSTAGGDGTFHQVSLDGGDTWAAPDRNDDSGGLSGLPSFAVDTAGTLHYLIGRVFYANWAKGSVSPYQDVATEPVRAQATKSNGEQGILAMTSGNRLHVIFELDFTSVWYTSKLLDVPPAPTPASQPVLPPTASAEPAASTAQPAATIVPEPPLPTTELLIANRQQSSDSTALPFVAGVLPALILVVIVVGVRLGRRNRQ